MICIVEGTYAIVFIATNLWKDPKKSVRIKPTNREAKTKKMSLSTFMALKEETESNKNDDETNMCSPLGGNAELWFPDDDAKENEIVKKKNAKYQERKFDIERICVDDEPNAEQMHCLSKFRYNKLCGDHVIDDIDNKIEHIRILIDQLNGSICDVNDKEPAGDACHEINFAVDSGACDIVASPNAYQRTPLSRPKFQQ